MKIKLVLLTLVLALANIRANPEAEGEMWIRVSNSSDALRSGVRITVYDINWQFVDDCITSNIPVEQQGDPTPKSATKS
ncbi:MAG: hypothetical protein AB1521_17550 [Bacteroidota bacterium]